MDSDKKIKLFIISLFIICFDFFMFTIIVYLTNISYYLEKLSGNFGSYKIYYLPNIITYGFIAVVILQIILIKKISSHID